MPEKIMLSEAERSALSWLKAQASSATGCVEIASTVDRIAMRDSKDPDGPILVYTPTEFSAFLEGARNREFDHLVRSSSSDNRRMGWLERMVDVADRAVQAGNARTASLVALLTVAAAAAALVLMASR
jgi:Domain of unknown function (DUF397)